MTRTKVEGHASLPNLEVGLLGAARKGGGSPHRPTGARQGPDP